MKQRSEEQQTKRLLRFVLGKWKQGAVEKGKDLPEKKGQEQVGHENKKKLETGGTAKFG